MPPWRREQNFTTSTLPSRVSKTFFSTTPEGACGNELEDVHSTALPGRARGAEESGAAADANPAPAAALHLRFRRGDDLERPDAGNVQEHVAARHHGDQHGDGGHPG